MIAQGKGKTVPMPRAAEPAIRRGACECANEDVSGFVNDYPPHGSELEGVGLTYGVSQLVGQDSPTPRRRALRIFLHRSKQATGKTKCFQCGISPRRSSLGGSAEALQAVLRGCSLSAIAA